MKAAVLILFIYYSNMHSYFELLLFLYTHLYFNPSFALFFIVWNVSSLTLILFLLGNIFFKF